MHISHSVITDLFFCSCGSKRYRDKLFICHHPSHQQKKSAPVQRRTFNNSDLLPCIYRQLQRIELKTQGITDNRILTAITYHSYNKTENIQSALRDLKNITLDKNTQHLIDMYLDPNNENVYIPY